VVNLLIRGGYVLAMDWAGDVARGDIDVRDGDSQSTGRNLAVPAAELIDACGKSVTPDKAGPGR
jgi:cytosine/adenosine deaminase-related metal-dependent hydrolase